MERPTALVTGASAGIGREFARLLASEGYDLVVTARRADRLSELSAELRERHGVGVLEISADLADPEAPERLCRELHGAGHAIDLLVNNAGFGGVGRFESLDQIRQREMIDVNVTALTRLAGLLLPGMKSRARGGIINVASTAAFQAGPFMAVYYASKAYALSFSEALSEECRGTGVTVTCLCPGVTATEFFEAAGFEGMPLYRVDMMDAARVARRGYDGWRAGRVIILPGLRNRLLVLGSRILPRAVTRRVIRVLQEKSGGVI
jgi:short-subunit dehydrogenase